MKSHESDPLEREIEAALSVDPSPDFVMRVRRSVAADPVPAPRLIPRFVMVGLASAAVVAIAVVAFRPQPPKENEKENVIAAAPLIASASVNVPQPPVPAPVLPVSKPAAKVFIPVSEQPVPEQSVQTSENADQQQEETLMPGALAGIALQPFDVPPLYISAAGPITLQPLPEMLLNPIAKLEGITIEPLTLDRDNGVHQ